ncbi:hypothetical protein CROQUDRAFT_92251 [Cronartium quercuum f. sp. fusiforme G11]|uniref:HTH CENPB-type domain-containing protein n=1 Tax=Cronartium quercuum f. sp. fusiforme G11 TaxID=708437 RepID=A0A9P6NGY9_9BASI|nr:hypothetical protein CROQUDRAFT_92251 [Cronartium quercuum f. sp. fusiforme G11]
MLSRSTPSTLLTHQSFLPSISTLPPDPSYHHPPQNQQHLPIHHHHYQPLPVHLQSYRPLSAHHSLPHSLPHSHSHPNSHPHQPPSRSVSIAHPPGRPPPKTARRQSKLNNLDRRRICEYAAAHPKSTQEDIALQWGIDRSSVSKILKYRDKWLSISPTARAAKVIKHRGGRFPQLESEVVRRCRVRAVEGSFLGDRTIKDLALEVSQEIGLGEGAFKASNGWLDAFKERAQIKGGRFLEPAGHLPPPPSSALISERPGSAASEMASAAEPLARALTPQATLHSATPLIHEEGDDDDAEDEEEAEEEEDEEEDDDDDEEEGEEEEEAEDDDEEGEAEDEDELAERSARSISPIQLYSPRPSPVAGQRSAGEHSATPPLSSPNSSTTGERPLSQPKHLPSPAQPTTEKDAMEGVEEYGDEMETSAAEETVIFPSHPNHQPNSQHQPSFSVQGRYEYRPSSIELRQSSSTHSRSSSVSVSSSVYDPYPTHTLPPPPARRPFPSLRHALSHPALHTPGSATSPAYYHPYASPGSAPPTHLAHTRPYPTYSMPRSAGPELAPVCASRIGRLRPLSATHKDEQEWGSSSSASADWSGPPTSSSRSRTGVVGFEEALGALETVMRFLQEQPTSFATPRDYMVVGELFGRMKEKKVEMATGVMGGFGMMKLNTTSTPNNNNNSNSTAPKLSRHSSSQTLSLVLEHRSGSPASCSDHHHHHHQHRHQQHSQHQVESMEH